MMFEPLRKLTRNTAQYLWGEQGRAYRAFFGADGYRDPVRYRSDLGRMAIQKPGWITQSWLSPSTVQNRKIGLVRLRSPSLPAGAPRMLVTGLLHAREFITGETAVELIDHLVRGRDDLLRRCEVDVIPVANPDGFAANVQRVQGWQGRFGPLKRGNARGVDLNRNFGAGWTKEHRTYRARLSEEFNGQSAFSENESQALRALVLDRGYVAAVNLHSYSSVFLYPSYRDENAPDPVVREIVATLPGLQPTEPYEVYQGARFYARSSMSRALVRAARGTTEVHGTFDDWLVEQGCHPLVIEVSRPGPAREHLGELALSNLRMFNPAPDARRKAVENVLPAIAGYLHAVLDRRGT
jgi:hypothetical protein